MMSRYCRVPGIHLPLRSRCGGGHPESSFWSRVELLKTTTEKVAGAQTESVARRKALPSCFLGLFLRCFVFLLFLIRSFGPEG